MDKQQILKAVNSFRGANREFSQEMGPIVEGILDLIDEGGGGGSSDAVKYTQQELTEEQQSQARTNIGGASAASVIAERDRASAAELEIMDALDGRNAETVTVLPEASASTVGKIYYVGPDSDGEYARYRGIESNGSYSFLPLGSTEMDLTDYATEAELSQLDQKVNKNVVSDSALHNSIVKELVIDDPANVSTDVYTINYIDRARYGAWRFQINKNGANFLIFSSTTYVEAPYLEFSNGTARFRAIVDWSLMEVGQRISTVATLNKTVLNANFWPIISATYVVTSGQIVTDYNTDNLIWQRLYNRANGEQVAGSVSVQPSATGSVDLVKNTYFPYIGNSFKVTFVGSNGNCIVRIDLPAGTKNTSKKFKFFFEVYVSTKTGSSAYYYLGSDSNSNGFTNDLVANGVCSKVGNFSASDLGGDWFSIRLFGSANTVFQVGRMQLIDISNGDIALPYMQVQAPLSELNIGAKRSAVAGKKLCTLGDSITYQEYWQLELCRLTGMYYNGLETRHATAPLAVGGSSLCPAILLSTNSSGTPAVDDGGNPIKDAENHPLYFPTGHGVGQSLYSRVANLDGLGAQVISLWGGQNDTLGMTYSTAGEVTDTPYEGKQYVSAQYAAVAKYYGGASHDIAIIDDGTAVLDEEYTGGDYTILTVAPTFSACVAGLIKKVLTTYPAAKVFGISLMRSESSETERRIEKNAALMATYAHYAIPCVDLWNNMGANTFNYSTYFADDVHPNAAGGLRIAEVIAQELV